MKPKKFGVVIFVMILCIFACLHYMESKQKYLGYKRISLTADEMRYNAKRSYSHNTYEIVYRPVEGYSELCYRDDEYYYINRFSDISYDDMQKIEKMRTRLTEFETVLILDYVYKNGINDGQDITSTMIKNKPFDKTCYWEYLVTRKYDASQYTHKRKKGTSPKDIDGLNHIMAAVYYFHKWIWIIAVMLIGFVIFKIYRKCKQIK